MQITKLNHLAKIKITPDNCDEIITESLELMKQASSLKLRSMQIKRGIANKREHQQIAGAKE